MAVCKGKVNGELDPGEGGVAGGGWGGGEPGEQPVDDVFGSRHEPLDPAMVEVADGVAEGGQEDAGRREALNDVEAVRRGDVFVLGVVGVGVLVDELFDDGLDFELGYLTGESAFEGADSLSHRGGLLVLVCYWVAVFCTVLFRLRSFLGVRCPHPSLLPVGEGACFFRRGVIGVFGQPGNAIRDEPRRVCPFRYYRTYVLYRQGRVCGGSHRGDSDVRTDKPSWSLGERKRMRLRVI